MKQLLSVIIPVKNKLEMTQKTIDSLIANTPNLGEILLIDDHSTENFTEMKHVKYYLNPGTGVTDAWNFGASIAEYPFLAFINNDLVFTPAWEEPLINSLNNDVWVTSPFHTAFELPDDFPKGLGRHPNMEAQSTGIKFLGSCFIMKKENWDRIGPIDERLKIWCGDNYIYETVVNDFGRQCKEIPQSYIHHYISQTLKPLLDSGSGMKEQVKEDMKTFDRIYGERRWKLGGNYPWIPEFIDLRLKLPMKDLWKMKVLNVGVGDMMSGLARQLPFLRFNELTNIDIHQPYIDEAIKRNWFAQTLNFENCDAKDYDQYNDYDLIMVFDVFEHLLKEESLKIIKSITKPLLIFIPLEKQFRPNKYDAKSQDHLSLWTEEDFKQLGFKTEVLKDFHKEPEDTFDALWAWKY